MVFIKSRTAVIVTIFRSAWARPMPHCIPSLSLSHNPSQALYADLNNAFATHGKVRTGVDVGTRLAQSKSGKPIRTVLDGLDITTLDLSCDAKKLLEKNRFIAPAWNHALPQNPPHASPYTSTVVFLVPKGNPNGLIDWDDLLRTGIEVVTPIEGFLKVAAGITWRRGGMRSGNPAAAKRPRLSLSGNCSPMSGRRRRLTSSNTVSATCC